MMKKYWYLLFGLALASLLTSCEVARAAAEFLGLATGDPSPEDLERFADSNLDGVISGVKEWFWYILAGGAAGGVKAARMAGVPIPKLGPKLDQIGLGRTKDQRETDELLADLKAQRKSATSDG